MKEKQINQSTDIETLEQWEQLPEMARNLWLHNAYCSHCKSATSFEQTYTLHQSPYGIVIRGHCVKCGGKIARVCD